MAPQPPAPLHYDSQLQFPLARTNLGLAIVFGILAVSAFVLRVIARRQTKARLQGDDWVMAIATVIAFGQCVMSAWAAVHGGLGVPAQYLRKATAIAFLKQTFAQELLSTAAIGLIKVSVCLYYKRIFAANKKFLMCINIMILLSIGWTLAFFLCLTFSVYPVSGHWALGSGAKHNLNFGHLLIAMATTSVALDLAVLSMPVPMVRKLHLSSRKKLVVGSIFGLGAFCVVASIVRLVYIIKFLRVATRNTSDAFTSAENQIAIWSNIEPCASVLCACLPTYGPFIQKALRGEVGLGSGLSNVVRARLNRSTNKVPSVPGSGYGKSFHSDSSNSEGANSIRSATFHGADATTTTTTTTGAGTYVDHEVVDEKQTKNPGTITVSRTFGVSNDHRSDA